MSLSPRPWGARQAIPYLLVPAPVEWASVSIDGETQMGCYLDGSGQPLQMGKHGTNVAQPSPQPTGGGDGPNPQQPDEITVTDYVTVEDSD